MAMLSIAMYVCPSCIEFYLHTVLRASGLTAKDANGIHDIPELTPCYFIYSIVPMFNYRPE